MSANDTNQIRKLIRDANLSLSQIQRQGSRRLAPGEVAIAIMSLFRREILDRGQEENLERLLNLYRCKQPFASLTDPELRDYLILIEVQGEQLKKVTQENKRLTHENARLWNDITRGTLFAALEAGKAKTPEERIRAQQQIRKAEKEWTQEQARRQRHAMEEATRATRIASRDRTPESALPVNWLEPKPIFSDQEPFGFCQATGKNRKIVQEFLRSVNAKPIDQIVKGRGRPISLFGNATNLRVLDQWLGCWLPQDMESKTNAIVNCVAWHMQLGLSFLETEPLRGVLSNHVVSMDFSPNCLDVISALILQGLGNQDWWNICRKKLFDSGRKLQDIPGGWCEPQSFLGIKDFL